MKSISKEFTIPPDYRRYSGPWESWIFEPGDLIRVVVDIENAQGEAVRASQTER